MMGRVLLLFASELGTCKTVKARLWHLLSVKARLWLLISGNVIKNPSCSHFGSGPARCVGLESGKMMGRVLLLAMMSTTCFENTDACADTCVEGRCKATWKGKFKLPWREADPPNHHDDNVDSDQ